MKLKLLVGRKCRFSGKGREVSTGEGCRWTEGIRVRKGVGGERVSGWGGREEGGDRMECQNETLLFSF